MDFNPISILTSGVVETVTKGLKAVGIIKDPETELKTQELIQSALKQNQDFFLNYFTATIGKDEPWYSPSKLFRPLCSFAIIVFYAIAKFKNIAFTGVDEALLLGVVGFWFGGRTLEKLAGKSK
jgi:hypothetical protein